MPYTSAEHLRLHLATPYPVSSRVHNQEVLMQASATTQFFNGGVDEGSVVVKSIRSHELTRTQVTLVAGTGQFSILPVAPGSVVVANSSSLGVVYVENIDYVVDLDSGTLKRKSAGAITDSQTLTVWYAPFTILAGGIDFTLDAQRGTLKRLGSGSISDGETVLVDYSPLFATIDDELLTSAALEANALIDAEIDADKAQSGDAVLQSAATYRALEIVCRTAAARELARRTGNDAESQMWLKLAEGYADRSERLVRIYRPSLSGPTPPTKG